MNYATVTTLPKGIQINVVGQQGYWLKVESKHGAAPGYIDEQFAEPESNAQNTTTRRALEPVAGLYRTLMDVDLRQVLARIIQLWAKLPSGIKVNVVGAEGDWLTIESARGATPGYLEKRFVERWTGN